MDMYFSLEIASVVLSLVFLVLLLKEIIWCWIFGIVSSLLGIIILIEVKLYSEVILYSFYVAMGFYGWWVWAKRSRDEAKDGGSIQQLPLKWSILGFLIAAMGALILGQFFYTQSDAARPFADATTTAFSMLATFLEAHKILSAWLYWVAINAFSTWLFYDRGLVLYALLMLVYGVVSAYGFFQWNKQMRNQAA